jgi:hypothetical protein
VLSKDSSEIPFEKRVFLLDLVQLTLNMDATQEKKKIPLKLCLNFLVHNVSDNINWILIATKENASLNQH